MKNILCDNPVEHNHWKDRKFPCPLCAAIKMQQKEKESQEQLAKLIAKELHHLILRDLKDFLNV